MLMRIPLLKTLLLMSCLFLTACLDSTYSRGLFQGYVMDQTPEVVKDKVGKASAEDVSAKSMKWVYVKKTFDPDNMNSFDAQTTVTFQKDAKGQYKAFSVEFGS